MKKLSTLFKKDPNDLNRVINKINLLMNGFMRTEYLHVNLTVQVVLLSAVNYIRDMMLKLIKKLANIKNKYH